VSDFTLFVCGLVVTLVAGLGVITSEVFLGYSRYLKSIQDDSLKEDEKKSSLKQKSSLKENYGDI